MRRLFGTDGIRGVANNYPMTVEMALKIGKATAHIFKREGHARKIIIGKDTRISGDMIEHALVSGICSMGVTGLLAGVIPSPAIAYLTHNMRVDAGIMISASHNPFQDNGIKIFSHNGFKLSDEKELEIEGLIFSDSLDKLTIPPETLGDVSKIDDAGGRYMAFLKKSFPQGLTLYGMKIILDCAHGAMYKIAPDTLYELGAEVVTLFNEPNGININLNCGSQHPEALAREVLKRQADVGFAFDGDGDRVIAVDEKGRVITGDQIIAFCARQMKREGVLKNNIVVTTVMSNIGLGLSLKEAGIEHIMTKVGDRYVLEGMMEKGSSIGGEDSGHIIFLDHHTSGDGIVTALQILAIMKKQGRPLSEIAKDMEVFPQRLINVNVREKPKISTIPEIMNIIKSVESKLGEKGRVLVRYSGTQPMCRIMVEGPTYKDTDEYCKKIAEVVKERLN